MAPKQPDTVAACVRGTEFLAGRVVITVSEATARFLAGYLTACPNPQPADLQKLIYELTSAPVWGTT